MQITLMRYAKVLMDNSTRCTASQMRAWVEEYDHAPIDTTRPSEETVAQIKSADRVVASALSRTKDSLAAIGVTPSEKNTLFNEAEIPDAKGNLLRLRPKTWLVILRLMMLVGIGKKSQSLKDSKHRAKAAASYLVSLSTKHESIVLMGHGGMNWLIGKELERLEWKICQSHGGNSNWGYRVYEKDKN